MRCDNPALTCCYTIQPAVLQRLVSDPDFRGRGLLGRFLYAIPAELFGQRMIDPDPVPEAVAALAGMMSKAAGPHATLAATGTDSNPAENW